jgi:hypothetical protein
MSSFVDANQHDDIDPHGGSPGPWAQGATWGPGPPYPSDSRGRGRAATPPTVGCLPLWSSQLTFPRSLLAFAFGRRASTGGRSRTHISRFWRPVLCHLSYTHIVDDPASRPPVHRLIRRGTKKPPPDRGSRGGGFRVDGTSRLHDSHLLGLTAMPEVRAGAHKATDRQSCYMFSHRTHLLGIP